MGGRERSSAGLLLACVIALGAACGPPPEGGGGESRAPFRAPAGTPVVLVSVDTLRSDRLPAYGHTAVRTPAFDALRADALLFERAYAHISLTLPSHASILTGLLPPTHRVRDNLGYRLDAASVPYLPRLLGEAGYATGAAVSAYVLRSTTGLSEGFDHYDDRVPMVSGQTLGGLQRRGEETLDAALRWLEEAAGRPFFLFFHIYEPHSPYSAPQPWSGLYDDPYDAEVAYADAIVGRLLDRLRELDLYDRALIVFLSDHGEGLGDHGEQEHELLLYREALQVPLILKLPGNARAGETFGEPVQLADVTPTVLDILDLPVPAAVAGRSLLGAPLQERPLFSENVYGRLHYGWSELTSVIQGRYHYIHGPDPELYDLVADPAETRDLVASDRPTAQRLRRALDAFDSDLAPPSAVDPETRSRLESLGYVGTFAADGGSRADPKSRLHVVAMLAEARALMDADRAEAAAERYRAILAEEPRMIDAWESLGRALQRADRFSEAVAAYRTALELSGGAPHIALAAAEAYLELGDLDEAARHAELAVSLHDVAPDLLAQVALKRKDLEEAERWAAEAVRRRGTRIGPLITQAELRRAQGRQAEAVALTEQAEREFGDRGDTAVLKGMHYVRGVSLAEMGRAREAEQALSREIELFPDHLDAYTHLAYLYALLGEAQAAGLTLKALVDANPSPSAYAAAVRTLEQMEDRHSAAALLRDALRRWPDAPELRELQGP